MSSATKDKADDAECQRKSLSLNANFALPRATIRARFGFKAVHVGLNYPTEFPRVLSQSGSFWWNESWLSQNLTASGPRIAFRLTVGSDETNENVEHTDHGRKLFQRESQVASNRRIWDALSAAGHWVSYDEHAGGHDFSQWRARLATSLIALTHTPVQQRPMP